MQRLLVFLFTLLVLGAHAQQTKKPSATYNQDWQRVDSLNLKGLPQSALTLINQIYKRAKAERNERQLVKAIIYRQSLQKYSDAGSTFQTVQSLQQELAGGALSIPARNILQSVLAETYWQYYQQNRWKFQDRTTIVRGPAIRRPGQNQSAENQVDSLATWDLRRLITEIITAYKTSLKSEATLKETPIAAYDLLLDKGSDEGRLRRPTVYDFLAHRALDFFKNTESDLVRPAQQFQLDQPAYLATPDRFATVSLRTSDSLSLRFQALTIYQRLIAFHLSDKNPIALADVDAERLTFVHQHSVFPEKDSLYQQTLAQQLARYQNQPAKFVYGLALAQYWEQQSYRNKTGNWRRQANSLITSLLQSPPDEGQDARNARNLQTQLRQQQLQLTVEEGNAPQQPIRALVDYRNTPSIYYRIVRVRFNESLPSSGISRSQRNQLLQRLLARPAVAEQAVKLPDNGDLRDHKTEIALPKLPIGHYLVLSAPTAQLTDSTALLAYTPLTVTELGYLVQGSQSGKTPPTLYVMHRQTGKPMPNVTVQLAESYFGNDIDQPRTLGSYKTDKLGRLQIPKTAKTNFNYNFRLINQQDTLETNGVYNPGIQPASATVASQTRVLLFTDRAIYRPGQPIYFKGVLFVGTDNLQVVARQSAKAILIDANGEQVDTLALTSNEFGTVEGKFTAPTGRLTGTMTISILDSQIDVEVEEYKRPTFEVVADPVKGSYKLGQSITVTAIAKTFSGAPIDGAQVRYRITRQLLPHWPWLQRGWQVFPPMSSQVTEIGNGTLTTTNTGTMSLTFVASPDQSIDRKTNPIFQYTITFDVTDVSGETRSVTQTLRIGHSALTATLNIPEQVEASRQTIGILIQNAGGQSVPATGQLTVYPIQAPQPTLRKRLWEQPDRFALTREEFKRLFPRDVYQDEDQPSTWPRNQAVPQLAVRTSGRDSVSLDLSKYPAGAYVAELTVADSSGETVKQTQYFTVTTPERPVLAVLADNWVRVVEPEVKAGQTATIWLANDGPGWALMRTGTQEKWVELGDKPVRVDVPIPTSTRSNVSVSFTKIQNGLFYQDTKTILVSQANQRLTIETITFRDRLKPGQLEEWTLRISGPGKEKVMAEAVATLYDASLDQFRKLEWGDVERYNAQDYSFDEYWSNNGFETQGSIAVNDGGRPSTYRVTAYDALKRIGRFYQAGGAARRDITGAVALKSEVAVAAAPKNESTFGNDDALLNEVVAVGYGQPKTALANEPQPTPRRNFNETAFFFPTLHTDKEGRILLKFTMPEALTRWRLMLFAHSKTMQTGNLERSVVTQKELMITTNAPRFLREGDTLRLTARINNLIDKSLSGTAQLELFDAATNLPIDTKLKHTPTPTAFSTQANQSTALGWTLVIPAGLENVTFRVTAKAGAFTDGEERTLPVLPNRTLVLDSRPFYLNGPGTKTVTLDALKNQKNIASQAERLTVELTSNPVWTALQSLPYLDNQSLLCAEQLFSQFYANALGSRIVSARPDIQQVVAKWQKQAPANPLAANEELKAVTLTETPWRQAARTQTEQQAQLGQFLQTDNLLTRQQIALDKLKQLQMPDGGLVWFAGMPTDPVVTLHVLSGFGHLAKLGVTFNSSQQQQIQTIQNSALQFADTYANQWLERQQKEKVTDGLSYWAVQYLYTRSFYLTTAADSKALAYIKTQVVKNWLRSGLQEQAMIALALHRLGDKKTPADILKSLNERATTSDELGMYWPANKAGFYWQQAPVETQSLLIEAFDEIAGDQTAVNNMKQWLLAQKRTQAWPSTKATTEAVYALLLKGNEWTATQPMTELRVGGTLVTSSTDEPTGYQKVTYQPTQIKPDLGTVTVKKSNSGPAWGGIYYQHFEPLDQVTSSTGDLSIRKTLYRRQDSPEGPVITPISEQTTLKPGDLVTVRVELRNDRDMQYVHLKDSRASGFEPVATLSGYKFQNDLGYYEAPRDASTDFFLHRLPAGTHVFEYQVRVVHTGAFAAGIATVQSFYAPEFSAHSTGSRVSVK